MLPIKSIASVLLAFASAESLAQQLVNPPQAETATNASAESLAQQSVNPPQAETATNAAARSTPQVLPYKPVTIDGVTIYGLVDVAYAYQSHGTPLDGKYPTGLGYVISSNSNKAIESFAPNALSSSKFGIQGREKLTDDLTAVAQLEMQFMPTSGELDNGIGSEIANNGRARTDVSTNGDSSKSGQLFGGMAYGGISSIKYGTMTFGRQYSVLLDNLLKYDPNVLSTAFSVLGFQGGTSGGGSTEDARLDNSVKYAINVNDVRFLALFQSGDRQWPTVRGYQFDAGWDYSGLSVDVAYSEMKSGMAASALSAAQVKTDPVDSVAVTVADNTAYAAYVRYAFSKLKLYGGYELIEQRNPAHPLQVGDNTIGGYEIGVVNNAAYPHAKHLNYHWIGFQYELTPKFMMQGAYYGDFQNSYGSHPCSDTSASTCSGYLGAVSLVGIYKVASHFDVYSGAMNSRVDGGLASGFLHTSSIDPMVGIRVSF
jgi:predicted porin